MQNERACANSPAMSRRSLFAALPSAGLALALPSSAGADNRSAVLELIRELESPQGWEMSNVVAAKAYAAFRLREAMGLDLPDPEYARMHLDYQGRCFEDYSRSLLAERDVAAGNVMTPPRAASSI